MRSKITTCIILILFGSVSAYADNQVRISEPVVHENLAVYFIYGESEKGSVPLTLSEAMEANKVRIYETGNVQQLKIENLSSEKVFIQTGDIVKGGKQDRVVTTTFILAANSGQVPIGAFCVERGRWAQRKGENVQRFSSSSKRAPRTVRRGLFLKKTHVSQHASRSRVRTTSVSRQAEIWNSVSETKKKLEKNVGISVASKTSPSSLQLALEAEQLGKLKKAYLDTIVAAGKKTTNIIGYAAVINGKIVSADIYSSNGLFQKMWSKVANSVAVEAIAEKDKYAKQALPEQRDVAAFLDSYDKGEKMERVLPLSMKVEEYVSEQLLYSQTATAVGEIIHKSYVAK